MYPFLASLLTFGPENVRRGISIFDRGRNNLLGGIAPEGPIKNLAGTSYSRLEIATSEKCCMSPIPSPQLQVVRRGKPNFEDPAGGDSEGDRKFQF